MRFEHERARFQDRVLIISRLEYHIMSFSSQAQYSLVLLNEKEMEMRREGVRLGCIIKV